MLQGASILLIIGGGIAAYKSLELIRELKKRGCSVRVILTKAGHQFVTPLSIAALSGEKVFDDLFSLTDEVEMGHIQLSRSADLVVVAPATADLMAKMATGQASDLATTALLATDKRVLIAPAMNVRMWQHPATQRNLATLTGDGVAVVGPNAGDMACGEFGPGRMAEPLEIVAAIDGLLAGPPTMPAQRRSPAGMCWSPPGRPMSRSTPSAIWPTARPASRAMPSPQRPGAPVHASHSSAARSPSPIPPASRRSVSRPHSRCWTRSSARCQQTSRSLPLPSPTGVSRQRRARRSRSRAGGRRRWP
jgi:3-polyprenyl-4-hydroxybenzoate decarboxylase